VFLRCLWELPQAMDLFHRDARLQTAACGALMNIAGGPGGKVRAHNTQWVEGRKWQLPGLGGEEGVGVDVMVVGGGAAAWAAACMSRAVWRLAYCVCVGGSHWAGKWWEPGVAPVITAPGSLHTLPASAAMCARCVPPWASLHRLSDRALLLCVCRVCSCLLHPSRRP
jgi:hypothetical protein